MGYYDLVGEFIGYLVISFITFLVFLLGAIVFGMNIPMQQLGIGAGFFGLIFYGLFKSIARR